MENIEYEVRKHLAEVEEKLKVEELRLALNNYSLEELALLGKI